MEHVSGNELTGYFKDIIKKKEVIFVFYFLKHLLTYILIFFLLGFKLSLI